MPEASREDVKNIKDGVDGVLSDVPEPSEEFGSETIEETMPETSYDGENTESYDIPEQIPSEASLGTGSSQPIDSGRIHEIIEAVIDERWDELIGKVGNIAVWKEKISNDVIAIKQELVRVDENFRQLQNAILGRIKDYDQGIRGVHTEMKALEKVFEKILDPLSSNIKDLTRITQELKKIKK